MSNIIKRAQEVLAVEAQSVKDLIKKIDISFEKAVLMILQTKGRVIITGMGKGGLIGRKISATLASTGTPSLFIHPAEAIHGDLGMIMREDIVICISNSGETEEVTKVVPLIRRIGCNLIAMTGNKKSTLAKNSDVVLDVSVKKEACSLGLAPTSSTTAMLALGDALAIVLLDEKKFKADDFAFLHAGGELGRKLMVKVKDVMRVGVLNPVISKDKKVKEALKIITKAKSGAISIVGSNGKMLGIFTDGDLRRKYAENKNIAELKIGEVMTKSPLCINQDKLAVEALRIMQDNKIDELPVVNDNNILTGMLDIQDLLKMGFL